jgi:hypothetical protein
MPLDCGIVADIFTGDSEMTVVDTARWEDVGGISSYAYGATSRLR